MYTPVHANTFKVAVKTYKVQVIICLSDNKSVKIILYPLSSKKLFIRCRQAKEIVKLNFHLP